MEVEIANVKFNKTEKETCTIYSREEEGETWFTCSHKGEKLIGYDRKDSRCLFQVENTYVARNMFPVVKVNPYNYLEITKILSFEKGDLFGVYHSDFSTSSFHLLKPDGEFVHVVDIPGYIGLTRIKKTGPNEAEYQDNVSISKPNVSYISPCILTFKF